MIIYKTTNLLNGKWYVGRDSKNNPDYLGSGTALKRAIVKYGRENFKKEILELLPEKSSIEDLIKKETEWILSTNACLDINSYNIKKDGKCGISSDAWTKEMRQEASDRAKKQSTKEIVIARTKIVKKWMSNKANLKKLSDIKKDFFKNPENVNKARLATLKSIKEKPEQRINQKKSLIEYYKSIDRNKLAEKYDSKYFWAINKKTKEKVWFGCNQRLCSEELNIPQPNINKCLKNKRKSAGGFIFVLKEQYGN
jgi:group I intron endonuclease